MAGASRQEAPLSYLSIEILKESVEVSRRPRNGAYCFAQILPTA
jgi:hypothetical protein